MARSLRTVDNEKVVASAGVSTEADAALHIVERLLVSDAARKTAEHVEHAWTPGKADGK